ncbi:MAG TPA: MFS transporter [Terriglobales bacterium]|jgi:MFS family permease|nr:MFS transporter [Terriglobales bacterium]
MTATAGPTSDKNGAAGNSGLLALLVVSAFINYVDRANLSIAAPLLKNDLGISATQLGMLLSAFFWTYSTFQIVSGWLVDRFDVNRIMALGFLVWSVATAATGIANTLAVLFVMRLLLGIGESVVYPSYSKILARHFPEQRRGFANAVIAAGVSCGPAFGLFAGGMLMSKVGWRPFFIALGLTSIAWLYPWLRWMSRQPAINISSGKQPAAGLRDILQQRSAWGTFAGLFCLNYVSYFLITWLPFYLVREREFSMGLMARVGGAAFLMSAMSATVSGWLSDRWIGSGGSPTLVRKTFMATGLTGAGISLAVCVMAGAAISVIFLFLASLFYGMCASNVWAITQTLAGPKAAGKWTGVQNFVGNMAGVVAPALTGYVVDRTGKFLLPFVITSVVAIVGSLFCLFVVGPIEQIEWKPASLLEPHSASPLA